jgi:hypothetical protein
VAGGWRRLHNELHNLYISPDIINGVIISRRMRWMGHVVQRGEVRNAYKILVRKSEEKRPFGRPMCRWEDNFRMDLRDWTVDWIHLILVRTHYWWALVNTVMNL